MNAPESLNFGKNAVKALHDPDLQKAMANIQGVLVGGRARAVAAVPEFEALREHGKAIKDHVLDHLDVYLKLYERAVLARGGHVHWAADAAEAREIVLEICRSSGAKLVVKGKTMISEEIDLNAALSAAGLDPLETDLGEYIVQLRGERPSHILAPAVHVHGAQIADAFRKAHPLDPARSLETPAEMLAEARAMLREKFLAADVAITGANALIAETGTSVLVTNEGNGDLGQTIAKTHIVLAGIEKVVPTFADAQTILRLLTRSATGQECSAYTSYASGPRRAGDTDGPLEYHVVLLDNGRTSMLQGELRDMLRCIRCSACMNHCPVYGAVGGHAYGWVYPGPMGSVLTPGLMGLHQAFDLPLASTVCGRCDSVCPVKIPLTSLMRSLRNRVHEEKLGAGGKRRALAFWRFAALHPRLYSLITKVAARSLRWWGWGRGWTDSLPLARGWTKGRTMPLPQGRTFRELWAEEEKRR